MPEIGNALPVIGNGVEWPIGIMVENRLGWFGTKVYL
ncbi:hypothetical protein FEAC_02150 [Ferrimicrobium acidiphilum DSM 19497]|jgi:hypothetical protein|uniref:Uncharacterized protein n=1 Tax=Ferrimicrobium acidiphilum DSM 19497 TaxID=1121877 RepID=A0A0D8FX45_9ACTN|nr:hypothetical protein FEAC_02150 [Ferrimicrobium acidiphilum DSM 19497]